MGDKRYGGWFRLNALYMRPLYLNSNRYSMCSVVCLMILSHTKLIQPTQIAAQGMKNCFSLLMFFFVVWQSKKLINH